ncbi:hypothetical protein G4D82_11425 [Flavobacterium sp. CYK-4]|uniref:hypothetical protein n=1 Tax=Flavobacterium lotistagni TaxID=2709660 RepID=UPI00140C7331|nr:hypothetical protein [Flavobacterium lotistagni]NHM07833.1 hypothetical protein [Flavobacterium lotistagni]
MKNKLILILLSLCCLSVSAQKKKSKKPKLADFTITQTKTLKKTGTQLFLKKVISDARCPEGTDCIWPGEAQANISVYKKGKWNDEQILTFSPKTQDENKQWIAEQLSIPIEKIKSVTLFPYPKNEVKINPKSYVIKVAINP